MVSSTNNKLTPFQNECLLLVHKINELKLSCEANVVSILYKAPEKIQECDLSIEDFTNNYWRSMFAIFYAVVVEEGKKTIDPIITGTYLDAHPKLKQLYTENNGWQTIEDAGAYVKVDALNGYVDELHKWNCLLELAKHGWIDKSKMSWYADASLDDIYALYTANINDIFIHADQNVHSHDVTDGIDSLIDQLDKGEEVGLPFYNLPMLSQKVNGVSCGNLTFVAGLSNAGKSTFVRNTIVPSCIQNHEKVCFILNEEDLSKFQQEMLVLVANVIFKADLQKYVVRSGNFTDEVKDILHKSANWLKQNTENHMITVIPFQRYTTALAIKVMRKYAAMGVKYFVLDTLKMDSTSSGNQVWMELQRSSIEIYDAIKSANLNVSLTVTYQLAKSSANTRYLTLDSLGVSKNVIDVASTVIGLRMLLPDEYSGESHEVTVYRLEGKNGRTKIPVQLDADKRYLVMYTIKNRAGSANDFQIVCEVDYSRNLMKEIGICNIMPDNFG